MRLHVHFDTKGVLLNFKPREWVRVVKDPATGRHLTPDEVKTWLLDQLAEGKTALPYGEPCEGFSFTTGCPGHESAGGHGAVTRFVREAVETALRGGS